MYTNGNCILEWVVLKFIKEIKPFKVEHESMDLYMQVISWD